MNGTINDMINSSLYDDDDEFIVQCPFCKCSDNYVHMVRTWVKGSNTIACDGGTSELDALANSLFVDTPIYRGSAVIIMYYNEFCPHVWLEITTFCKGTTSKHIKQISSGDLLKYTNDTDVILRKEMWRD